MSSFIGKVFGKKDKAPTTQEAIEKLRDTEDMLNKKQVGLSRVRDASFSIAFEGIFGTKS